MANQDPITEKYFVRASENSEWFKNLKRVGSCKVLRDLLQKNPLLLKEMGNGDVTVLDMGVRHGYVELVDDVIKMFIPGGQCKHEGINFTMEELLSKRNAEGLTVIGIAVMIGSFEIVKLLKAAIQSCGEKHMLHGDENVNDPRLCTSLKYPTWILSTRNIQPPDLNPFPMDDDGKGKMNSHVAFPPSPSNSSGDDVATRTLPVDEHVPSQSPSYENERVQEIIEKVRLDPIKYMKKMPGHQIRAGGSTFLSFNDFREENSDFTEGHVRKCIQHWGDECEMHPEFEFVPVKGVFVHFLCTVDLMSRGPPDEEIQNCVRFYYIAAVVWRCMSRKVLKALFKLHDPQGRTPLHVAIEHSNLVIVEMFWRLMEKFELQDPGGLIDGEADECWNARDAAGRTPLHAIVMSRFDSIKDLLRVKWVDVHARVYPQQYEDWVALLHWKAPYVTLSPKYEEHEHCNAIHLAVLHNHVDAVKQLIELPLRPGKDKFNDHINDRVQRSRFLPEKQYFSAIQLAASMGHIKILMLLLHEQRAQDGGKWDIKILDHHDGTSWMPALHCSAFFGQVEATRAILSSGCYDQFALSSTSSTALHYAVTLHNADARERLQNHLLTLQDFMPYDSVATKVIEERWPSSLYNSVRKYTGNEMSCIILLLQAGIDVWTTNKRGEAPFPGSMADSEASQWWYEKVVSEALNVKKSLGDAANATSVIAALVGTASFIGPLQPPRGYDSTEGYVRVDHMLIQIYLIGNCLSFFFSVASIITAVIPSLPMPKESMDDEVKRSQRSIRVACMLLLISIVCILVSFSAASIAVIPFGWSERCTVGICIVLGGVVCLVVLILYVLRLCRLVFHQRRFMRRMYNKYVRV